MRIVNHTESWTYLDYEKVQTLPPSFPFGTPGRKGNRQIDLTSLTQIKYCEIRFGPDNLLSLNIVRKMGEQVKAIVIITGWMGLLTNGFGIHQYVSEVDKLQSYVFTLTYFYLKCCVYIRLRRLKL